MKCQICKKEVPKSLNSIVCSEKCNAVRLKIFELIHKYYPSNGCPNCWGDLHQGCTDVCKKESLDAHNFAMDLWKLIHLNYYR